MAAIKITYEDELRTVVTHEGNGAVIHTDAPKDNQGKGELFSPTDLLAVSLGSCILTTMAIVGRRLQIGLKGMRATVQKTMRQLPARKVGKLVVHIFVPEQLALEIAAKLEKAAKECPVHHSLHPEVEQELYFHWGEE